MGLEVRCAVVAIVAVVVIVAAVVIVTVEVVRSTPEIEETTNSLQKSTKPHIIIIYADDLGWNDVSMHGSAEIPTPNIDALAMGGIKLHAYYGMHVCTPSRAALLSGLLPMHLGLQHSIILPEEPSALTIGVVTMPQHLKNMGYSTHMVGKWHLGHMTKEYTPTYRGFDSFFGYYNGILDYYTYTTYVPSSTGEPISIGIDLHNGTEHITSFVGKYATEVFTNVSTQIIADHDPANPLFLYLSHAAPHAENLLGLPEKAPPHDIRNFMYIKDLKRRIHAARMHALDKSVGEVFQALLQKSMLDNSIVLLASDNGGLTDGSSSNHPLRGGKKTLWEGGVRVVAAVWSPLFQLKRPRVYTELMHVADWMPTLYEAAGGDVGDLGAIYGISMWESFVNNTQSPRTNVLVNIDSIQNVSAYRENHLKLTVGKDVLDGWLGPESVDVNQLSDTTMEDWVFKNGSRVRDILVSQGQWIVEDIQQWYASLRLQCGEGSSVCDAQLKPCLFNITEDPCEYRNIASDHPQTVSEMLATIHKYEETAAPPMNKESDPNADPMCHDFLYVPWMDPEYATTCDYREGIS